MPLSFDETLKAKTAYWGIVDPSKLLPFINEENVVYSDAKDWSLASDISIGTDENAFMKLLWKDGKLIARVTVKDSSKNKNDAVTFYYDLNNQKAATLKPRICIVNVTRAIITRLHSTTSRIQLP